MSMDAANNHPRVFISYSHDSDKHRERVLGLAQRLRADGFETMIDRYVEGTPPQGWPRWMLNQIDWADYILLVCTETYYRRFRGQEAPGIGEGVDWEGAVIANDLYDAKSVTQRFVPVLFSAEEKENVPEPLRGHTFYVLGSEPAYVALTDFLAGIAGIEPHPVGSSPERTKKTVPPLEFEVLANSGPMRTANARARPDLSAQPAPGGMMPADDQFYVERGADRSAATAAKRRGETVVIRGPSQFGKSSLLARYLALCRAAGKTVASVDFTMFDRSVVSDYSRFLDALGAQLARRLRLPAPTTTFRTQQEFLTFLESALLPALPGPLVFAFDNTDRILRQDYAPDFFSMVRMWHNDRADPTLEWSKVGLALASSSEPKLYITDALRSPFNVGLRLPLEPFDETEAAALNTRYGSALTDGECAKLHGLVGGHPFLTQDAYFRLFGSDPIPFADLEATASQDDGPFGDHLRATLANLQARDGLRTAMQQVIAHGTVPKEEDYYRLEGAGLVGRKNGRIIPTTQIYADFFRPLR